MAKAPLTPQEREAVRKRDRMAAIETQYLRAKEYEKSEECFTGQVRALLKIRGIMRQGLMQDTEALQMVGRVQQVLLDTYQYEEVIVEYEGLKQSLREYFPDG